MADHWTNLAVQVAPWPRNQALFHEVNHRLMSPPHTNYQHWDYLEANELELYLVRCKQLEDEPWLPPCFKENWGNLLKAYEYCDVLASKYMPVPLPALEEDPCFSLEGRPFNGRVESKRPLKQAIREGRVIDPWRSFDTQKGIEACRAALETLDKCVQLEDPAAPPLVITVKEYMEARKRENLLSFMLKKFNQSDRLQLKP